MKEIVFVHVYETEAFGQGAGSKIASFLTEAQARNVKKPLIFY